MITTANSNAQSKIGSVNTLSSKTRYQADPLTLFKKLCGDQYNNLLLESAEIDKKHQLKSLLLIDAAVKIVCHGNQVTFIPLSLNGEAAVDFARQQLVSHADLLTENKVLSATFPDIPQKLDEKSRLLAANPFHCLRLFNQLTNLSHHPFAIFLAGVFAFEMINVTEALPEVADSDNKCPDFVYYLAETLVVIDHEKRSSEVIANVFFRTRTAKVLLRNFPSVVGNQKFSGQ
jgi:anthranilate synthase component 1